MIKQNDKQIKLNGYIISSTHEIGHTLGLDHSNLPTDVMHDGLDHRIHSLMPPSFHAEQIILMNYAISQHKS